jgi:hypothetical protein
LIVAWFGISLSADRRSAAFGIDYGAAPKKLQEESKFFTDAQKNPANQLKTNKACMINSE